MSEHLPKASAADIGLLLEGTFPYVSGGVSSWVNQIIRAFPEYTFAVVFIGSTPEDYGEMKYTLPDNVVHLETHYIHDPEQKPVARTMRGDHKATQQLEQLHQYFRTPQAHPESQDLFFRLLPQCEPGKSLDYAHFLHAETSWEFIKKTYQQYCYDPSFVDFFWTIRIMHAPIWRLLEVAHKMPQVRVLHTVSTGYAGFLGAMTKHLRGMPLVLSEHGIYTKERKIDLFQANWVRDNRNAFERDSTQVGYFREMWVRFFESIGRMCYSTADDIIALYEENRLRQVADGAPPEKTRNIPNGVDVTRLAVLRQQRPASPPPVLCLIGRVVPIKDIKTFIRAMRTVVNRMPEAEGWIAGPEDEDPQYAAECHALVDSLGLSDKVRFLGFQQITDLMPQIGLVVLSSISEALPLVILEGYAAGVPCVSTDVGSCRQLVEGLGEEDKALGASGRIVNIAEPAALAEAAIELLGNPQEWQKAQQAGIRRVETYYSQPLMIERYRDTYRNALALAQAMDGMGAS